jgi:pimeloyl-ACP methyl ester carboxylesterase
MRGEGTVTLADGRAIGYADYGVADGIPIFEFHGLPGSRYYTLRADALEAAGARLVTLERPGFGLSDPKPGRTLLDWPDDVAEVADHFGFDRFAVLGYSAGGPNAIATGYALPDRVAVVGIAASVGAVFDNPELDTLQSADFQALLPLARTDRDAAIAIVRDFTKPTADAWASDPDGYFETFVEGWPAAMHAWLRATADLWMKTLSATYDRGPDTVTDEIASTYGPWGFDAADVRVPVRAWHGSADDIKIENIQFLVDRIPDATLTIHEGEPHGIDEKYHDEWVAELTRWAR